MGWMYPKLQAIKMQANNSRDKPTRMPRAPAIFFDVLAASFCPPRIIKNSAAPKLAKIATNAMLTRYVMNWIIW